MPVKKIKNRDRFVVETEEERETLVDARDYFGSSRLLFNRLGYHSGSGSVVMYSAVYKGKNTISLEAWKIVEESARKYNSGERLSTSV